VVELVTVLARQMPDQAIAAQARGRNRQCLAKAPAPGRVNARGRYCGKPLPRKSHDGADPRPFPREGWRPASRP
jgi:hypothetical protein